MGRGGKKRIFKKVFLSSLTFQIKMELFLLRIKWFFSFLEYSTSILSE